MPFMLSQPETAFTRRCLRLVYSMTLLPEAMILFASSTEISFGAMSGKNFLNPILKLVAIAFAFATFSAFSCSSLILRSLSCSSCSFFFSLSFIISCISLVSYPFLMEMKQILGYLSF